MTGVSLKIIKHLALIKTQHSISNKGEDEKYEGLLYLALMVVIELLEKMVAAAAMAGI